MIKILPQISANEETNDTSRPIEKIQDDSTSILQEGFGGLEKKIDTKFKTLNSSLRKIQDSILTKIDLSAKDSLQATKLYIDGKFNVKKPNSNEPDANPNLFKDLNSSVLALTATLESKPPKSYIDRDLNVSVSDNNASTGFFASINTTLASISVRLDTLISGGNPKSEDSVFNEKSIPNEMDRLNENLEHLDKNILDGEGRSNNTKDNPILKAIIGLFGAGGAMTTLLGSTGTLVAGIGTLFAAGWAIKSIFNAKDFPDFMNKSGLNALGKNIPKVLQEVADNIKDPDTTLPNKPKANRQQNMTELGLGYYGRGVDVLRDKSKVIGTGAQALSSPTLGLMTVGAAASGFFTGGAGWAATAPLATAFLASLGSDYAQGVYKSKEISGSNDPDTKVASGWAQMGSNMTYGFVSPKDVYKFISSSSSGESGKIDENERRSYTSLLKVLDAELAKKNISKETYNKQLKIVQDYHKRGEVVEYLKVRKMQKQIDEDEKRKAELRKKALGSNSPETSTHANVITQNQTTNTYIRKSINVSPEDAQYAGLIKLNNEKHPWIA